MRYSALVLVLLLVTGCKVNKTPAVQTRLEAAAASGATSFDFAGDPSFEWDRMFVFDCYTSQTDVESALGFKWSGYKKTSISSSDSVVLVVFVKSQQVATWYEQPRHIELGGLANGSGYDRADTTFAIDRSGGRPTLLPHPAAP